MNGRLKLIVFLVLTGACIAVSFLHFSSAFFPYLNSDDALRILMIPSLHLPADLYCWGQNYGGSLLQILAWPLYKMGMPAYWADSVINYLLLCLGYYFFMLSFKSKSARFFFAILWFLPPLFLNSLLRFPVGMQYCTLAPAYYLGTMLTERYARLTWWHRLLISAAIALLFLISVWTYDFSILFILVIAAWTFVLKGIQAENKGKWLMRLLSSPALWVFIVLMITGIGCLAFTRNMNTTFGIYEKRFFGNSAEIIITIKRLFTTSWRVLSFNCHNVFMSLWGWGTIVLVMFLIVQLIRNFRRSLRASQAWFFFLLAAAGLFAIMISRWVYEMELAQRYFVVIYIPLGISFLLFYEHFGWTRNKILRACLLILLSCGAVSSLISFYYPKHVGPRVNVAAEFGRLAPAGFISEYWNAYIAAVHDPEVITATPNEQDFVRLEEYPDIVMSRPSIYLIRDHWLETFPDTIFQFGQMLVRADQEFFLGDSYLCRYRKASFVRDYAVGAMFNKAYIPVTDTVNGKLLQTDTLPGAEPYICGPDIQLGPGTYQISWLVNLMHVPASGSAVVKVTDRLVPEPLAELTFTPESLPADRGFTKLTLTLVLPKRVKHIECHLFLYGGVTAVVSGMHIRQL